MKLNSRERKYLMKKQKGFLLMNLPPEILIEILSRLPAPAVIRCKSVCKTWLQILSDPQFVSLHFANARARPGLVVHQIEMFKSFIKLVGFEDKTYRHDLDRDSLVKFDLKRVSESPDANMVLDGSVNGLLCLRDADYEQETVYICNPITREYVKLPAPEGMIGHEYHGIVTYGFGVSRVAGEYKVVRVCHDQVLDPISQACVRVPWSECQVYTLGTRSWRSIKNYKFNFAYGGRCRSVGLFFNGNIHWMIQDLDEDSHELISCFDLEKEAFRPFPSPFPGRQGLLVSLGVLKDSLCLCDNTSFLEMNIWVMKEYGVEKSWTREFVVGKMRPLVGPTLEVVYPMKVFKDGVIMVLWGDFFMMYCCNKSNFGEEVDMEQSRGPNRIEAMLHVPSLLSLKKIGLENVTNF